MVFRRRSDSSLASSSSYITTVTPSPLDILHWKMDFATTSDSLNGQLCELDGLSLAATSMQHIPPPIPSKRITSVKMQKQLPTNSLGMDREDSDNALYITF